MSEHIVKRFEELIAAGGQLVPQGGFDFSGYNARLQNNYLEWRKACLEILELSGPIGVSYKNKIMHDIRGGFFFQASAHLILSQIQELYDKLKASPELASATPSPQEATVAASVPSSDAGGPRTIKPPPKPATASTAAPSPAARNNKVYVIGESNDPLRLQLGEFLGEIGLTEVAVNRQRGQMLNLDSFGDQKDVQLAFFVVTAADLSYAMFELGHFVGKLGKGHVCVLHMADVDFPKNIPGVTVKPIVVKLEETSFGLMKELKALGYQIRL